MPLPSTSSRYAAENAARDEREVDEHLDEPAPVEDDVRSIQLPATPRRRAALEVGEEAGELHEQREGDQHADERDPASPSTL